MEAKYSFVFEAKLHSMYIAFIGNIMIDIEITPLRAVL